MTENVVCADCGVNFTDLARTPYNQFYCTCPNHASFRPPPYQDRIAEVNRIVEMEKERELARRSEYYKLDDLLGALRRCIVPGCSWRSRSEVLPDERGVETLRRDLVEHLVSDHELSTPGGSR